MNIGGLERIKAQEKPIDRNRAPGPNVNDAHSNWNVVASTSSVEGMKEGH